MLSDEIMLSVKRLSLWRMNSFWINAKPSGFLSRWFISSKKIVWQCFPVQNLNNGAKNIPEPIEASKNGKAN